MPVVSIRQKFEESSEWGDTNHRVRTRVYELLVDTLLDEAETIETAAGVPQIHSAWNETDTFIRVSRIRAKRDNQNPYLWSVEVEYTTDLYLPSSSYLNNDPIERKAEVATNVETYTEAIDRAYAEDDTFTIPIVNTSNEPFIPPMTREFGRLVFTIQLHIETMDYVSFGGYYYATNSAIWYGFPINTLLITDLQVTQSFQSARASTGKPYHWLLNAKIKYNRKTWNRKPMNIGKLMKITRAHGVIAYVPIRGPDHRPITTPMPLTVDSQPIWPGSGGVFHYLDFRVYERLPFDGLIPEARMP